MFNYVIIDGKKEGKEKKCGHGDTVLREVLPDASRVVEILEKNFSGLAKLVSMDACNFDTYRMINVKNGERYILSNDKEIYEVGYDNDTSDVKATHMIFFDDLLVIIYI